MALHASSTSLKSPDLNGAGEEAQQKRDKEMKDMVSALNHRLVQLQAANKHDHPDHDDDDKRGERGGGGGGRSIITLTGDNTGATMRFLIPSGDHRKAHKVQDGVDVDVGEEEEEEGEKQVYTNSNFQGLNNSIMLNGSYSAKDPGVHMVVSDDYGRRSKKKFRGKKKDRKGSTSTDSDITTSDSD